MFLKRMNPSLPKNKQTSRYIYRTYSFACGGGIGDKSKRWNRFSGKEAPGNPLFVLPAGQISYSLLSIENEDHCRCSISLPGEMFARGISHRNACAPFPFATLSSRIHTVFLRFLVSSRSYKDFRFWSYSDVAE